MYPKTQEEIDQLILPTEDGGIWHGYRFNEDFSFFISESTDPEDIAFNGFFVDHRAGTFGNPCMSIRSHWVKERQSAIALCIAFAFFYDENIL